MYIVKQLGRAWLILSRLLALDAKMGFVLGLCATDGAHISQTVLQIGRDIYKLPFE